MGFLEPKQPKPEMEVIEDEIEAAEEELEELTQKVEVKEASKIETVVVKELPVQTVRSTVKEDGTKVEFITTEEALTKIMNS